MDELGTLNGGRAAWILAANMFLHEVGVPVPVLPTGLLLGANAMHGAGDFLLLVVAMVLAMLVANLLWYAAGRQYGVRVLNVICRFSLSADTCVAKAEQAFARWGWSALVVGHFLPGVSLIAPPLAGAVGMSWSAFIVLTTAGGVAFSLAVLGAGYLMRDQIAVALHWLHEFGWDAVVAIAVLIAAYVAWRWWRRRVARAPDIPRISVTELEALVATGERPLIVDVRGDASQRLDPRRIPDALAVSLEAIESRHDNLPRDRKIVLYCACPNEASAAKAARLLLNRGFSWVRPLRGGLESWTLVNGTAAR